VTTPVLALEGVRKEFGGVVPIERIDLELHAGEIVALLGDNDAGKSTLVKIIAGVHPPTARRILMDGSPISFLNPCAAQAHGIQVVYQDLALADQQPVYMNMFSLTVGKVTG